MAASAGRALITCPLSQLPAPGPDRLRPLLEASLAPVHPSCSSASPGQLPDRDLLAAIRRHRLELVLAHHPQLAAALAPAARRQTLAALALIHHTRELAHRFALAGLPVLVFKGVVLAQQTTGHPAGRGQGDLDLLIAPDTLPAALALLEAAGFQREPGHYPRGLHGLRGRYCLWTGDQLLLSRPTPTGAVQVDLHWSLAIPRSAMPPFATLWRERQIIDLAGQPVATFGRCHALQQACLHAAKDWWMLQRTLVDIDRLALGLSPSDCQRLRRHRLVRWSAAVAHHATGGAHLLALAGRPSRGSRIAVRQATISQALPPRCFGQAPWAPWHPLVSLGRQLLLTADPRDWPRCLARCLLPPASFSDPHSGADISLASLLPTRCGHLLARLQGRLSGSSPASAQSVPVP